METFHEDVREYVICSHLSLSACHTLTL